MPEPGDLHALAQEFLNACIEALDTIPAFDATLSGAPDRSFVGPPGNPAFDNCCESSSGGGQLSIHAGPITDRPPGALIGGEHRFDAKINHIQLTAWIVRCVPVGDDRRAATAAEIETASEQINADGWALWNHLYNLLRAEQLLTLCDEVHWDGMQPVNPSGGCGGWRLTLRAQLSGYEEAIST